MKVCELIEALKKMPQDLDVVDFMYNDVTNVEDEDDFVMLS